MKQVKSTVPVVKSNLDANSNLSKIKITACVLTKNDQKYIEGCLKSLKPVCDEILVFDIGSTDKTKEIAKKYATVSTLKYSDDISKLKNEAIKNIKNDWILFIEPDEALTKETQLNLISFIESRKNKNLPMVFKFRIIEQNKAQLNIYYKACLFRNHKGITFINPIYEEPYKKDGKMLITNVEFLTVHNIGNKKRTKDEINKKNEAKLYLLNKLIKNSKQESDLALYYYHLANILTNTGKYEEALKNYKQVYNLLGKKSKERLFFYENVLVSIAYLLIFKLDNYQEAFKYIKEFLSKYDNFPEVLFYKAICLKRNGQIHDAKDILLEIISIMSNGTAIIVGINTFQNNFYFNVMLELAKCYLLLGDNKNCFSCLENAYKQKKDVKELLITTVLFYINNGDFSKAIRYYYELLDEKQKESQNYLTRVFDLHNTDIRKLNTILTILEMLPRLSTNLSVEEIQLVGKNYAEISNSIAKISVCIISYNNEKVIETCIKSVLPIASEILIFDLNSKDKTLEVASPYGTLLTVNGFNYYTKNTILDNVKNEWVLFIQGNQEISTEIQQNIMAFLNELTKEKNVGISMKIPAFYNIEEGKKDVLSLLKLSKNVRFDEKDKLYAKNGTIKSIITNFDLNFIF